MTHITFLSKRYEILVTSHTNELAETLGFNIAGEEFIGDESPTGKTIRGYIKRGLYGNVGMSFPITLHPDDLKVITP